MTPLDRYFVIQSEDLVWRFSNLIKIPNADSLEPGKSGSDVLWIIIGARGAELRLTEESDTALSYDPKQVPEKLPELRWPFFA